MINKVSSNEKEIMKGFIEDYAFSDSYEQHSIIASIDTILAPWNEAKSQYLNQLFNNELILSKELLYTKSPEQIESEIISKLFKIGTTSARFLRDIRKLTYNDGIFRDCYMLQDLVTPATLAENEYTGKTFNLTFPDGKTIKIQKGCKPIKVLGHIAKKLFLEEAFEEFRIAHSMIFNQKKLKGKLCLSIHPLDYITMSTNSYNWNSCMDWTGSGEFRRGTVEMMNSPMVVVAYLEGAEPLELRKGSWSNKKWRELFIIDKNLITGIKGYPFANEALEKEVLDWLKALAKKNLNWEYCNTCISYVPRENFEYNQKKYFIQFHTDAMYNDFSSSDGNMMYISPDLPRYYTLNYSGVEECMCCGNTDEFNYESEYDLLCSICNPYLSCCCCGDYVDRDTMTEVDGYYYCQYCYEEEISCCAMTNTLHNVHNLLTLSLVTKGNPSSIISTCSVEENFIYKFYNNLIFQESKDSYTEGFYCFAEDVPLEWINVFGYNSREECLKDAI